jgi:hypothetical protein
VPDRWRGALLFLPVPLVLFLFTRAPLGIAWSLVLGVAVMVTHRLYARPFALARASRRCLWCGRALPPGSPALTVEEPIDTTRWHTCAGGHEERARRFLGRAGRHSLALRIGILLPLAVFLATAGLAAARYPWPVTFGDAVAGFRLAIASTLLPLALATSLEDRGRPLPADPLRVPFPVHIQALIGTRAVLWLFRIMGTLWLLAGAAHFLHRY